MYMWVASESSLHVRDPACGPEAAIPLFQQGYAAYQPKTCSFPMDAKGRRFIIRWYTSFKWLDYSPRLNQAFCFPCRIFAHNDKAFIGVGFQKWKDALEKFRNHEKSVSHKTAYISEMD